MQYRRLTIGILATALLPIPMLCGQFPSGATTEFITSSSPLPDGSIVTTTYYPKLGTAPETRLTAGTGISPAIASPFAIAAKPAIEQSVLAGSLPLPPPNSSLPMAAPALPTTVQVPPTTGVVTNPATTNIVQVPAWGNPFAGPRRYLPPNYQPAEYSLGYPQVTAGYLPTGTIYPYPVASTPPTLSGPISYPTAPYNSGTRANFRPLIRFQNLPPGTYMGQGIIGQPTAYVDGQPLRNLLRYIFP